MHKHHHPTNLPHLPILLLLLLLLHPHPSTSNRVHPKKSGILIGEIGQHDNSRPIYSVHFPATGAHHPSTTTTTSTKTNGEVLRLQTLKGQSLKCVIPELREDGTSMKEEEVVVKDGEGEGDGDVFSGIDELMSVYENQCYFRGVPREWWVFEFCYGKYVKQTHRGSGEGGDEDVEYVLGVYDREVDLERRKRRRRKNKGNRNVVSYEDVPFTQVFENGTVCDLTGKPRKTVVKFKCLYDIRYLTESPKDVSLISGVREVESCVYEVDFVSSAICGHPLYKEVGDRNVYEIQCSMEDGQDPFKGFGVKNYRKSAITL